MTVSPEKVPEMTNSTACLLCCIKSDVAALATDSQYVTFPKDGMTTTKPGSEDPVGGATSEPNGRGSDAELEGWRAKVKVSGDVLWPA